MEGPVRGDADLAAVAAVIGHPARGRMLAALLGGPALPAGELAAAARVAPSTASAHLARLEAAGLVTVEPLGRRRLFRLAGHQVAEALEVLAGLAPAGAPRSLRAVDRATAERAARSCYDHLAGALGVAVTDRLCAMGAIDRASFRLLDPAPFEVLGIDVGRIAGARRPLTRSCLDWSERRPHLAGGLGAAVLAAMLASGWLVRRPLGRAVAVTRSGRDGLEEVFGLGQAVTLPA